MSMPVRLLTTLLAVVATATSLSAAELLTMKFREGETYTYRIQQEMETSGTAGDQKFESGMTQQLDLRTLIKSVDADGRAQAEQTVDRIKMKMTFPPPVSQTIEVDTASDKQPTDPGTIAIAKNLAQMVGQAVSLTIAPDGKITNVVVPEAMKASQQIPGAPGGEGIEQTLKQTGLRLPDEPVTKGKSWDQHAEVKIPFGTMTIVTTYTYDGKTQDGLDKIDATMAITLEPAANSPVKVALTTKEATGTFLFDNEAGRLVKSAVTQVLDIDLQGIGKQLVTTRFNTSLTDDADDKNSAPRTDNVNGKEN